MDQPLPAHSSKTDRSLSHPTIQSDLDSQTAPPQARNNASGYSAALSHGQRTGFAGGMAGIRYPLLCFPLLDDTSQCRPNQTRLPSSSVISLGMPIWSQ